MIAPPQRPLGLAVDRDFQVQSSTLAGLWRYKSNRIGCRAP